MLDQMPLPSEFITSLFNKSSLFHPFKLEVKLDPVPLQLELITFLSNKSSSKQPFMLTSPDEYNPFQAFLTRTSLIKWRFITVHSYRCHGQHSSQSLRLRFFVMLRFKSCGRVFSNQERIDEDIKDPAAIGRPIRAEERKSELDFIRSRRGLLLVSF